MLCRWPFSDNRIKSYNLANEAKFEKIVTFKN